MRKRFSWRRFAATVTVLGVVTVTPGTAKEYVEVEFSQAEVPKELLLDIGIRVFDPGLPADDPHALEESGVFPEVRRSEARYIPFQLKSTLESTGHWGAVRVIPPGTDSTDIVISGEIVESTGLKQQLRIRVVDSRGKLWNDRHYQDEADARAYHPDRVEVRDPYQGLYNRIANDLLQAKEKKDEEAIEEIRQTTQLRFGAEMAPSAFEDYLKANDRGRYKVQRLPSEDDPMVARIGAIRERDYMFVDTLNEYYSDFCTRMDQPYFDWRLYSYEEEVALREMRRKARLRKALGALLIFGGAAAGVHGGSGAAASNAAVIGGALVIKSGVEKGKEAKIHKIAIQELAASFDSEVESLLVEVEGHTLKLEGSAEAQYAEWRRLLRQIFLTETGLPLDPNADTAATEN